MKKIIILLFLAISFIMMVLISAMKFQATFNYQSPEETIIYPLERAHMVGTEYDLIIGP